MDHHLRQKHLFLLYSKYETATDDTNKVENNYNNSKVEVNGNKIQKENGPLLEKLLGIIDSFSSWR